MHKLLFVVIACSTLPIAAMNRTIQASRTLMPLVAKRTYSAWPYLNGYRPNNVHIEGVKTLREYEKEKRTWGCREKVAQENAEICKRMLQSLMTSLQVIDKESVHHGNLELQYTLQNLELMEEQLKKVLSITHMLLERKKSNQEAEEQAERLLFLRGQCYHEVEKEMTKIEKSIPKITFDPLAKD